MSPRALLPSAASRPPVFGDIPSAAYPPFHALITPNVLPVPSLVPPNLLRTTFSIRPFSRGPNPAPSSYRLSLIAVDRRWHYSFVPRVFFLSLVFLPSLLLKKVPISSLFCCPFNMVSSSNKNFLTSAGRQIAPPTSRPHHVWFPDPSLSDNCLSCSGSATNRSRIFFLRFSHRAWRGHRSFAGTELVLGRLLPF